MTPQDRRRDGRRGMATGVAGWTLAPGSGSILRPLPQARRPMNPIFHPHGIAAAVLCLLAMVLPASSAAQHWESWHSMDEAGFLEKNETFVAKGLMPLSIEAYHDGDDLRFAAKWQDVTGDLRYRHRIPASFMPGTMTQMRDDGYRPHSISAYTDDGELYYAGVWQQAEPDSHVARIDMSADGYVSEFKQQVGRGRYPILACGYANKGLPRYLSVFGTGGPGTWEARHNLTPAAYQKTVDELLAKGYLPVQVCGYHVGGQVLYAAVWHLNKERIGWSARHALSAEAYSQEFKRHTAEGYYLLHQDVFDVNGRPQFAAIWIK
jgi:hypothetical protein